MRLKLKKVLLRLLGFKLLLRKILKLLYKRMHSIQEAVNQKLWRFFFKGLALLLLLGLLGLAFVFSMLALALYLNEVCYSTYQGFLLVAGGCIGLLILLSALYWFRNKR